uniref:Type II toxin-antitoxin system death-on-curing family toxin n=1 Tax=Thermodesulfobacterium geofontis TaxID=1295609 RepID=A0A7V5XF32_9BACT
MNFITLEEILLIHEKVVLETGGIFGILNFEAIKSSLERPFSSFEGKEFYPDLWHKVAVLIHSIISYHPFIDGNKRTALVAGDVCLRLNGYRIRPSEEVEKFFWEIARGEKSIDDIAKWLQENSEPWEERTK